MGEWLRMVGLSEPGFAAMLGVAMTGAVFIGWHAGTLGERERWLDRIERGMDREREVQDGLRRDRRERSDGEPTDPGGPRDIGS